MPETVIRPALVAQELAVDLIEEHHDHLEEARLLWLFTTAKSTRGGRAVLGSSKRLGALARFMSSGNESIRSGYDFVLQISEQEWQTLKDPQKLALVDSLLCRCQVREVENKQTGEVSKAWCTVSPDVEEFSAVILRHGLWLPELRTFGKAIGSKQLRLLEQEDQRKAAQKPPAERTTTVDGSGVVESTELRTGREVATVDCSRCGGAGQLMVLGQAAPVVCPDCLDDGKRIVESGTTAADGSNGSVTDSEAPNRDSAPSSAPPPASSSNGSVADPPDHATTWQEQTGLGTSEHEQRRRTRRTGAPKPREEARA